MAEDTTKLIISVEVLLKNLDRTLRGLAQVEAQLKRISGTKTGSTAGGLDKAAIASQRLANQQQKLVIQSQELANRQARVDQTTQRLANSQQRLQAAQQRVIRSTGQQADAHVKAFKALQRGIEQADAHVRFFRANERALERAPQLDAHVQAFRAIQDATAAAQQRLIGIGNSFRSIGQGLLTFGTVLTAALTVPLAELGRASVTAAVQMDSLQRGLKAIVGSSAEAGRQLARLTEIAKLPGIGFEEAIQGSIRLQAVGFSARDAEQALKQFSNAVALTGGGRDELARITVQLGQLAAKGKVLSQDLRPIIEAAPAVGRALKQAFGTVNADDIAEMTSSSKEFLDILISELERLPRAAGGAKNSFENFRDTVFRAAAAVGEALLPALTKLAEIAGPIITLIAEGFKNLPGPLQAAVVASAAFAAVLGPLALVVGAFALAIGRTVVGIVQFNAQLPIGTAGLFGLATGANAATGAMTALRTALIATGVGAATLVVQLGIAIAAVALYNKATEASRDITNEQLDATKEQVDELKQQLTFIDGLKGGVARTADEQERLLGIYRNLNADAQERVGGIKNETVETEKLRAEVERLLQLRLQEREQQTATIAGSLADTLKLIEARKQESDAITDQITRNTELIAIQRANTDQNDNSILRINELSAANKDLLTAQGELSEENRKSTETARNYARQLIALGTTSTDQIRNFLSLKQAMGQFEGSVDEAVPILKQFIDGLNATADAARRVKAELGGIDALLKEASDSSEQLQKNRQERIRRAATLAREFGRNIDEATKAMQAFVRADPQLRAAIQREAEITGKTIEEIITDALGGAQRDRGAALRNAQEQLNDALDRVQQAATEKTIAQEKAKNDELLRINELRFRRELTSFQSFIVERARLQRQEIEQEIERQRSVTRLAGEDIERARARAGTTTGPEQRRAQADEQQALARRTQAEAKIIELRSRQREIAADAARELDDFTKERQRDFRELARELDEITGKEQEAAEAAIDERFADTLRGLRNELKAASIELIAAQAAGNKVAAQRAALTAEHLRSQITSINNFKRELGAVAEVAAVQEEIRRAEQEQVNLERRLAFEVEFRGLAEDEAIRQRLEGEAKVREAIEQQQVRLEVLAATLKAAGLAIPLALSQAIEQLKVASLGLGELPFVEQFRLAQQEFDRLNDQRVRKIQEVERAVAHRDISELQGRIAIRVANGQYVADLEGQAAILRRIAEESGDIGLQRQAEDARVLAQETRNATTEVASLERELKSVTIDSLHDAFAGFGRTLVDIARGATDAKDALLDMLDAVAGRLTDTLFQRLADQLFGGLLGGGQVPQAGGVVAAGGVGGGLGAEAALQAGATTAAATITTGAATASATFVTGVSAAAAAFTAAVAAAGAAFAAAVGVASGAQAVGGLGSSLAGAAAEGDLLPAKSGGRLIRVAEGGFDEVVLTTDPKYASRQFAILREYLRQTKGLFGRIPEFATGAMVEAQMLGQLSASRLPVPSLPAGLELEPAQASINFRSINLFDRDEMVRGYLRSATGERDILNIVSANGDEVGRRIGVRRR